MGHVNRRLGEDADNVTRELTADQGVPLTELVHGVVAGGRFEHGLTGVAEREFIAALTEKYGARELEVQVQPIPVKRGVGVGAAVVGHRGERTWLRPNEIRVTATADTETGRLRVCIGAPDSDAPLFLADVDSRHATAIRVKLSDLHPVPGGAARRPDRGTTQTC